MTQDNKQVRSVDDQNSSEAQQDAFESSDIPQQQPEEIGGPKGLEPTRYGDWERKGRCIDF